MYIQKMDSKASTVKVPAIPVVVKKGSTITLLKNNLSSNDLLKRCIKLSAVSTDQLIYKSVPGDFLRGEFPGLTLVSRLNLFNQTSSTVAKFVTNDGKGSVIEKNSNEVVKVIGQNNYDTVFSALCSVISQELRIRALLALLTIEGSNLKKAASAQTEKSYTDSASQTDETSKNILDNFKLRKRVRRQQFRPYIVKEDDKKLKRVVIDPKALQLNVLKPLQTTDTPKSNEILSNSIDAAKCIIKTDTNYPEKETFPELSGIVDEDSNFSDISIGNISLTSRDSVNLPQLLENPNSLLDDVDHHTEPLNIVPLTLLDGSIIMVCSKPIDKFHWTTPDILKNVSNADQMKLLYQQMIIHWKYCLERDDDGYLPIHQAVMSNDLEFLDKQCRALARKHGSVDIPATGNMTALQMSIYKDGERCTALLLENGADPCLQDDEGKNFFHTAAEVSHEHLKIALDHCRSKARTILMEDEELWNPVMEHKSDEQLAKILLDHISIMCDNQGYTPLMLASKQGNYIGVKLLLEASPETVNRPTPNSGSTALYLAVEAACIESANSNNQAKISDSFLKTIELLMESGGDPSLENHFGSSVNILLTEFNIVELSVLIANKLTSVKFFDGNSFAPSNINSLMLFKNSDGKVDLTEIRTRKVNEDSKNDVSAGTSNITKTNTKYSNTDVKVNANKETKKNSTPKVNNKTNDKGSNVEIKEIKIIKSKSELNTHSTSDKQPAVPTPVNVKQSHFFIVPNNMQLKQNIPKYVKILPKLHSETSKSDFVLDVKFKKKAIITDLKVNTGQTRKNKKNTDCEQTPNKRQRKEPRHSTKKKIDETSNIKDCKDNSNPDVDRKNELMTTTECE